MMYGTVETVEERLEHLLRLRALQDETGGFTAFITWSYQPQHTELGGTEATGVEYLRTLAIARIVLDNFDNLQASWVTQGGKVGQLSLAYGANDMGSVMIEENVVRAAGAEYCMDEFEVVRNIENAGFAARRRNMHYDILGDPIFRERDVPRMLELAVARADGRAGEADDLRDYEARSAAGTSRARGFEGRVGQRLERTSGTSSEPPGTQNSCEPQGTSVPMSTKCFRAKWLLPIERPPIDGGWIEIGGGRIVRVGSAAARPRPRRISATSRSCPVSSTRTRIVELSWLDGRVPPAASMDEWITADRADPPRRRAGRPRDGDLRGASGRRVDARDRHRARRRHLEHAAHAARSSPPPASAASSFTSCSASTRRIRRAPCARPGPASTRHAGPQEPREPPGTPEPAEPLDSSFSVVAHAPYSVSPALFSRDRRRAPARRRCRSTSASRPEEIEFLRTGRGPIRAHARDARRVDGRVAACRPAIRSST